jgi:hypothetical protein
MFDRLRHALRRALPVLAVVAATLAGSAGQRWH